MTEAATGTEAQEATGTEPTEEPFDADRAKEKISKANSEAANLRKRLKDLEPLAEAGRKAEEAKRTDAEKLTAAERERDEAQLDAARLRVALRKGLTEGQARRLVGGTEAELEQDADAYLDELPQPETSEAPARVPQRRPVEQLRAGASPTATALNADPLLDSLKDKLGIP